jgi:hypothetical protein
MLSGRRAPVSIQNSQPHHAHTLAVGPRAGQRGRRGPRVCARERLGSALSICLFWPPPPPICTALRGGRRAAPQPPPSPPPTGSWGGWRCRLPRCLLAHTHTHPAGDITCVKIAPAWPTLASFPSASFGACRRPTHIHTRTAAHCADAPPSGYLWAHSVRRPPSAPACRSRQLRRRPSPRTELSVVAIVLLHFMCVLFSSFIVRQPLALQLDSRILLLAMDARRREICLSAAAPRRQLESLARDCLANFTRPLGEPALPPPAALSRQAAHCGARRRLCKRSARRACRGRGFAKAAHKLPLPLCAACLYL